MNFNLHTVFFVHCSRPHCGILQIESLKCNLVDMVEERDAVIQQSAQRGEELTQEISDLRDSFEVD